jgi:FkbH-like protein
MKLAEALTLLEIERPAAATPLRVELACGFTPLHLLSFFDAYLRREFPQHAPQVATGRFGDLAGNLERAQHAPGDGGICLIEWSDLDPRLGIRALGGWGPSLLEDIGGHAQEQAVRLAALVATLAQSRPVVAALPTLPLPPLAFVPGWQTSVFEAALRQTAAELGARLAATPGVRVISAQRLDQLSPPAARFDIRSELAAGFPYSLAHADALAGLLARALRNPAPKKGLITDLDDTFWRGILGDVGVAAVAWELEQHAQAHGLYQQLLASLAEAGVLVAAASKNDAALVEEAFRARSVLLPRERIFPIEANWGPKSQSVSRILQAWNIGPEAVVFVDDSPLELAEVKAAHPEIECRLFPRRDDAGVYGLLQELRDLFGKQALSAEDGLRLNSLRAAHTAGAAGASGLTADRFLQEAAGVLSLRIQNDAGDARAFELINKTNQFNLNGERITEAAWQRYLAEPDVFLAVAAYTDKFGPLGKIAVIAGRRQDRNLLIEHWVMSCRAFSRRIEHATLRHLLDHFAADELEFAFAPTPRNGPLREFFAEWLPEAPAGGFRVPAGQFAERCPPLYLEVQDHIDG